MDNLLEVAKERSRNAIKSNDDYAETVYEMIDKAILRAAEYKDVTGIFIVQIEPRVYQVMYRETNSPLDQEYYYTHGADSFLLSIDDNTLPLEKIVDHYARLGFLSGIKVFRMYNSVQYRVLISWSDDEETDNKVNIHKYVDGVDIFANDSHPEAY